MQATGIKTTQSADNRNLLGILLAAVVLAAVITALVIVTSGQAVLGRPAAAPAPAYAHDSTLGRAEFPAEDRNFQVSVGSTPWIQPDAHDAAPKATVSSPRHMTGK
jgi:hypothetical protein